MKYDYQVDTTRPNTVVLSGTLRLASVGHYDELLAPVRAALETGPEQYTIDLRKVQFINSSGISTLSRLVLIARDFETRLLLRGRADVRWQARTLASFTRLSPKVAVELD